MSVLACDMGGTRIKIGIVRNGCVLAQEAIPAHSDRGLGPRLPALADAWRRLAASIDLKLETCRGIGVSFPSLMDMATGRILADYGKYSDAMNIDLRAWAHQEFGLPLAIDNDARMALIGEWRHGAAKGCDDAVMMTLGTGIGTAAIMQGHV